MTVNCTKINQSGRKGSHEQLWQVYLKAIEHIINEVKKLTPSAIVTGTIDKLSDLRANLIFSGHNGGNWLSRVRNEISYKHANGLWFPYRDIEKYFETIPNIINKWPLSPESIDITNFPSKPILKYLSSCIFIASLQLTLAKEMALRCPKGKSFLESGMFGLINRVNS